MGPERSPVPRALAWLRAHGPLPAIVLLALGLRLYGISDNALYPDELHSIDFASWARAFQVDIHPPLYFLLLAGWSQLGPGSDAFLRALSALCGALSVVPMFWIVRAWFDRRAALWASLLWALFAFNVFFSQEIRGYALLTLLSLCTAAAAVIYIRGGRRRVLVGYVLAAAAAAHVHNLGGLAAVAANLLFVAGYRRHELRRRLRPWITSQLVCALLCAPALYQLVVQKLWAMQTEWIPLISTSCALESMRDLGGASSWWIGAGSWTAALCGIVAGLAVARSRAVALEITIWTALQLLLVMTISLWISPLALGSRHFVQASFVLCWGWVLLLWLLPGRTARTVVLVLLLALELTALDRYYATPAKTEWRAAAALVGRGAPPRRDPTVIVDWDFTGRLLARYYPPPDSTLVVVRPLEGWDERGVEAVDAWARRVVRRRLAGRRARGVFLVHVDQPAVAALHRGLRRALRRRCRHERVTRFEDGGSLARCLGYYRPLVVVHHTGCRWRDRPAP